MSAPLLGRLSPRTLNSPREVDIALTAKCDLRCHYCYFFDNPGLSYKDISTQEWLSFFAECGRAGVMSLGLAGGEPFLRSDLRKLIDGIVQNRMRFHILSNGGRITEEIANYLALSGRCNYVQISLDGASPDAHDSARGTGSFLRAVNGIRLLQKHGVPVKVRCTIHKRNLDNLEALAKFVLEDLGIEQLSTNAVGYLGICQSNADDLLLSARDRSHCMSVLMDLDRRYPGRLTASAGPLAELSMFRTMESAKRQKLPRPRNAGTLTGCGCHRVKIAVRSDGYFTSCSLLDSISLGRINQDSLLEVWQSNDDLGRLRGRPQIDLSSFAYCSDCDYSDYCTGSCPAIAHSMTGDLQRPAPDACYRMFLEQGGILPLLDSQASTQ